jgi:uncharacterized repeat protein (TIGR01451 family)
MKPRGTQAPCCVAPGRPSSSRIAGIRPPATVVTALLTVGALIGSTVPANATDVRPFESRFARRVTGDISIVSTMSATATASRPAGSTLLFAGLYWGGPRRRTSTAVGEVTLQVGSAAPRTVVADDLATDATAGFGAVADVTAQFRGAGPSVDLTVATAGTSQWSLVTAWSSPAEPLRDLRVVDGLAQATAREPATVTVSDLSTPRRGPVETKSGVVTHGDPARAAVDVDAGDTSATIPVRTDPGAETLVAAVTTATEAAGVTDLGVSTAVDPDSAAAGETVEVTVTVTNSGPDDQTGPATLTVDPGSGLTADAVSLEVSAGACGLAGQRAVCAVDPLPAGRAAEVTFAARVEDAAGSTITPNARAHVPTSDNDPIAENDTGQTGLTLVDPAPNADPVSEQPDP